MPTIFFEKIDILLPDENAHFDVRCNRHGLIERKCPYANLMYAELAHMMTQHPRSTHLGK